MSVRLYVGNLPKEIIEKDALQNLFAEETNITTKLIKDRKTGKCRGFAFVTVANDEAADQFIAKFNGQSFLNSELKIEKALPREKTKGNEEEGGAEEETTAKAPAPTKANKKQPKSNQRSGKKQAPATSGQSTTDSVQPDPRWAADLAKLKEMLLAANP